MKGRSGAKNLMCIFLVSGPKGFVWYILLSTQRLIKTYTVQNRFSVSQAQDYGCFRGT